MMDEKQLSNSFEAMQLLIIKLFRFESNALGRLLDVINPPLAA